MRLRENENGAIRGIKASRSEGELVNWLLSKFFGIRTLDQSVERVGQLEKYLSLSWCFLSLVSEDIEIGPSESQT